MIFIQKLKDFKIETFNLGFENKDDDGRANRNQKCNFLGNELRMLSEPPYHPI